MPSFGMYTSEGTLVEWLFPDGAEVQMGDAIAAIETEKATNEIPAPASGVLRHAAPVGTLLKEEGVLGYILAAGELDAPRNLDFAQGHHEPVAGRAPSPESQAPANTGWIKASPIARRIAREHGLDIATLRPSGPGGRIVKADVCAALASVPGGSPPTPQAAFGGREGLPEVRSRAKLAAMRLTIGERLKRAQSTAASLTLVREVEADVLAAARERGRARWPTLSFDALFVKLLAAALHGHPLNSSIDEKDNTLVLFEDVNVGVAVSVTDGLLVPVVRRANSASLGDIEARIRDAAARARTNTLTSRGPRWRDDHDQQPWRIGDRRVHTDPQSAAVVHPGDWTNRAAAGGAQRQPRGGPNVRPQLDLRPPRVRRRACRAGARPDRRADER